MVERESPIVEGEVVEKFTIIDAEKTQSSPVHTEWYKAYREGNLLWPQVGMGMHIKLLDALMRCPPASAREFLTAQLSDAQVEEEIETMKKVHSARNITPHPWRFASGYPARMAKLWRWAKLSVSNEIIRYQTGSPEAEVINEAKNLDDTIILPLNGFFHDVIPSAQGDRIKRMVSDAVAALESPHGKALAAVHRFSQDNRNPAIVVPEMQAYCERKGVRFMGRNYNYLPLGKQYVNEQTSKYPVEMQRLLQV